MDKQTDNKADQGNPNNDAYWQSRGFKRRPADWKQRLSRQPKTKRSRRRDNRVGMDGGITTPFWKEDY